MTVVARRSSPAAVPARAGALALRAATRGRHRQLAPRPRAGTQVAQQLLDDGRGEVEQQSLADEQARTLVGVFRHGQRAHEIAAREVVGNVGDRVRRDTECGDAAALVLLGGGWSTLKERTPG
jgi:hypothetical protein